MPLYDVMVHDNKVERYRVEATSPEDAKAIIEAISVTIDPMPDEVEEMDLVSAEWYIDEVLEIRNPSDE